MTTYNMIIIMGRQASDEPLYVKRKDGRRGLKSLREVYEEARLCVGCYMFVSDTRWIKEAWEQEARKECISIKDEVILTMQRKGKTVQFEGEDMKLEGKTLDRGFKPIWKLVKKCIKKDIEEKRLELYRKKELQSEIYEKQDKKCNIWLEQDLTPRKTSVIMSLLEQLVETRAWKEVRGLTENSQCRLCKEQWDSVTSLS